MTASLSPAQVDRYLAILGVAREAPNLDALTRLVRAHKLALPFENTSAIRRRRAHLGHPLPPVPPIDATTLLDSWEGGGGGVCFELAELCYRLLSALGYRVARRFGRVSNDGDHQAVLVELDGARYLVDVGSSMPVLAPIPLGDVAETEHAGVVCRFRPGETEGELVAEQCTDGVWQTVFRYRLDEPAAGLAEASYQRLHTPGYAWVVDNLVVVRCTEDALFRLRGGTLTRVSAAGSTATPLAAPADYERAVREVVGLPRLPVAESLAAFAAIAPPA